MTRHTSRPPAGSIAPGTGTRYDARMTTFPRDEIAATVARFEAANQRAEARAEKQQAQLDRGDALTGPTAAMVDLAEAFVGMVSHADWAIFCKNGTDATSMAMVTARAHTRRKTLVLAKGAYHGGSPMFTPRDAGVTAEDRANLRYYTFNDLTSVEKTVADAGAEDVAGIIVSPYRHDAGFDQELVDAEFARGLRALCDRIGAALIMGSIVLMIQRERARELVERRVDWWTLSFFMMLFASVGTLQDTQVTQVIAEKLSGSGSSQMVTTQIIGWATGWLSAFLDNVLAVLKKG